MTESDTATRPPRRRRKSETRRWLVAILVIAIGLLLAGTILDLTGETRFGPHIRAFVSQLVGPPDTSLKIAAVYSGADGESNFIRGAQIATDSVNASDDGILGRRLALKLVGENGFSQSTALEKTVSRTLELSDEIVRTKNLVAVIGHEWSDTAVAASAIYNLNDVLFLATHATAASLTNHGFNTVFALQPDNATNAEMVANYALRSGLRHYLVLSDKSDYGKESANFFTEAITRAGADLIYRGYLSSSQRSVEQLLMFVLDNKSFKRGDFDAIFVVSSSVQKTAEFIKQARALNLEIPILGMEYMFSSAIEKYVGKKEMHDVVGVSLYDRDTLSKRALAFAADFRKAYGHAPDLSAALGYDAITLIRDLVNRSKSLDANTLSDTLKVARYKEQPFVGVTGQLLFDRNGLITDTRIFIVRHNGTEFHTVAKYEIPPKWDNILGTVEPDADLVPTPNNAGPPS